MPLISSDAIVFEGKDYDSLINKQSHPTMTALYEICVFQKIGILLRASFRFRLAVDILALGMAKAYLCYDAAFVIGDLRSTEQRLHRTFIKQCPHPHLTYSKKPAYAGFRCLYVYFIFD